MFIIKKIFLCLYLGQPESSVASHTTSAHAHLETNNFIHPVLTCCWGFTSQSCSCFCIRTLTGSQTFVSFIRRLHCEKRSYLRFLYLVFGLFSSLFLLAAQRKQGVLLHGQTVILKLNVCTEMSPLCSGQIAPQPEKPFFSNNINASSCQGRLAAGHQMSRSVGVIRHSNCVYKLFAMTVKERQMDGGWYDSKGHLSDIQTFSCSGPNISTAKKPLISAN